MNNARFAEPVNQTTLKDTLHLIGTGLHLGRRVSLSIRPADTGQGICFVRKDVSLGRGVVPALWHNAADSHLCTTVANEYGVTISTIEHLMAALRAYNVDNALIEIDGPEVPIMDGSADTFASMLEAVGVVSQDSPRRAILVRKPVKVHQGEKIAMLLPGRGSRFSMAIDFPDTLIGYQKYSLGLNSDRFARDISRARTFGLRSQVEHLLTQGLLRGGSLRNAIVVDGDLVLNTDGLRYQNEFVRHKLLDSIGDLFLAGMPIIGHFHGYKAGHHLNQVLLTTLFSRPDTWSYIDLADLDHSHSFKEYNSFSSRTDLTRPLFLETCS